MITYDQFKQISTELRALGVKTTDRRVGGRVGLRCPVLVFPFVNGRCEAPRRVCLKDLSGSGLGITSREPFTVGEQLIVKLSKLQDGADTTRSILCVVATCAALKGGLYSVGIAFK